MTTFTVGVLIGSLATESINRKLARALMRLAPEHLTFTEIAIKDLPLYSYDYDADFPPVARTFKEAIQKALRGLETGRWGFGNVPGRAHCPPEDLHTEAIRPHLATPRADRIDWIRTALMGGTSVDEVHEFTKIDPWFLDQLQELVDHERVIVEACQGGLAALDAELLRETKSLGFSDRQLANALTNVPGGASATRTASRISTRSASSTSGRSASPRVPPSASSTPGAGWSSRARRAIAAGPTPSSRQRTLPRPRTRSGVRSRSLNDRPPSTPGRSRGRRT